MRNQNSRLRTKTLLFLGAPFEYYKGGAEYQYHILEDHLKRKYDIYYLFSHPESLLERKYINYRYIFRKSYNKFLYTDGFAIYRLISRLSPDIIYKRGVNYIAAIGAYYARRKGIRMYLHISSQRDVEKPILEFTMKRFFFQFLNENIANFALRNASRIICQSEYQSVLLQRNFGRCCDLILPNIHLIPARHTNKKKSPIKVVWISNFKRLKQPEYFLELARVFRDDQSTRFIMIGKPQSGLWQENLFERMSQLPNLEYKGELSQEEVNEVLSRSHVFVNTSQYEGFPNTYIQAWMREVPVVTLNVDPDDYIKIHRIGFHSTTFQRLVKDVRMLVGNRVLREKMGKEAQRFSCNTFSVSNVEQLIDFLDQRE